MVEAFSTRTLPLGAPAPDFNLPDATGRHLTLEEARGCHGLLVAFLCNHCPTVAQLARPFALVAATARQLGFGVVGINANDFGSYPQDAPEKMVIFASGCGWTFPYLFDETQAVAKAYYAACTPDFFLFNEHLQLTYCGQFDNSRPGNGVAAVGGDLRRALDAALFGQPPLPNQRPSSGCCIKWRLGNEPDYFS